MLPSSYSMRDANGNLTMVNGQVTSSTYSSSSGAQYARRRSWHERCRTDVRTGHGHR